MIVRWTGPAADDFTHICSHTEKRFGAAQARRAAIAIYEAADALQDMPLRGRPGRKPGTRELTVASLPFQIIYCPRKESVEIDRILHGSQQWP